MQPDLPSKTFPVRISLKRLKDGPLVSLDNLLSREKEIELNEYFSWQKNHDN